MKKAKKLIILMILFIVYIWQMRVLFINNKENNLRNKALIEKHYETNYKVDVEEILNEINSMGFSVNNLKRDNSKINVDTFISPSKEEIIPSLERLKDSKYLIESYNITKYDNVDVRFNLKMP